MKPHWEDISELRASEYGRVYSVIHARIDALKHVLGAEKVYLCTMCDGGRSHLLYQLTPRMNSDETIGSKLFVSPRRFLVSAEEELSALSDYMTH